MPWPPATNITEAWWDARRQVAEAMMRAFPIVSVERSSSAVYDYKKEDWDA